MNKENELNELAKSLELINENKQKRMEKSKELLKKFGFNAEKVEDENFDIEKAFADFQKKQEDLFFLI